MDITQQSTFRGDPIAVEAESRLQSDGDSDAVIVEDLITANLLRQVNQALGDYQTYVDSLEPLIQPLLARLPLIDARQSRLHARDGNDQPAGQEGEYKPISTGKLSILALPFWLGEAFGIQEGVCRRFSVANIFGLLHFIALDKLVDGDSAAADVPGLAIASSLYQQQLAARYQEFFAPGSPFWPLMEKYWQEWAAAQVWERTVGLRPAFSSEDLLRSAHKAAPLKICTSGMALLGGRQERIPELEAAVDGMHVVMQMMDDLIDMGQDLASGAQLSERFNSALNMVATPEQAISQAGPQTKAAGIEKIGRHLFTSGRDGDYIAEMERIAAPIQIKLTNLGLADWAQLIGIIVRQARQWRDDHVEWIIAALNP